MPFLTLLFLSIQSYEQGLLHLATICSSVCTFLAKANFGYFDILVDFLSLKMGVRGIR